MKKITPILSIILAILMSMSAFIVSAGAETAERAPVISVQEASDSTGNAKVSVDFIKDFIALVTRVVTQMKLFILRLTGKSVVIEVSNYTDIIYDAKSGEKIKLMNDVSIDNLNITNAVTLDLNGHTLYCKNFTMANGLDNGVITVKNGTVVSESSVAVSAANVNIENLAAQIGNEGTVIFKSAVNGVTLSGNLEFTNSAANPVALTVTSDTKIIDMSNSAITMNVQSAAKNIIIEDKRSDTAQGTSALTINIPADAVNITVKDSRVAEAPVTNVNIESGATGVIIDNNTSKETAIAVNGEGAEDVVYWEDGGLPKGTEENPYVITTATQLELIRKNPDKFFVLGSDIDLAGVDFTPITEFSGVLDGQGYSIKNFTYSADQRYIAFILYNSGTIKRLGMENVNLETLGSNSNYWYAVAALVSDNDGTIENCFASGMIFANTATSDIMKMLGGIASSCGDGSIVKNCYSICGFDGNIVQFDGYTCGSFIGAPMNGSKVLDCYSDNRLGILKCNVWYANTVFDCTAITEETFKSGVAFEEWDTTVWQFTEGSYPSLIK